MANKKVKIDFEAQGLDEILKQIEDIKALATSIQVNNNVDIQLDHIEQKAKDIKIALEGVQETLNGVGKKKVKDTALADIQRKIKDLREGTTALHRSLTLFNTRMDSSLGKMETAMDKLRCEILK